jgi:cell division protein FtsN
MFHIVAGSFRNADYAEKFSSDMQSSGYNSKVLVQPTGMHAVTLGSFLTRQQAVDSMNVWKQKNPNIWILNQ